jgi:hypothetical protein
MSSPLAPPSLGGINSMGALVPPGSGLAGMPGLPPAPAQESSWGPLNGVFSFLAPVRKYAGYGFAAAGVATLLYAFYFDYRRRNDPAFRRRIREFSVARKTKLSSVLGSAFGLVYWQT